MSTAIEENRSTIIGVELKSLQSYPDDRGFFCEVLRKTDHIFKDGKFGQWSHSKMTKDVVKAWHFHHIQTDWWYLPIGEVRTVLVDHREESETFQQKMVIPMGDTSHITDGTGAVLVRIPPGVLHGCRVLSDEAHLFYITSETYNPDDEGRLPFNTDEVDYDWGAEAITSEKDRRTFIPPHPRKRD